MGPEVTGHAGLHPMGGPLAYNPVPAAFSLDLRPRPDGGKSGNQSNQQYSDKQLFPNVHASPQANFPDSIASGSNH